MPAKRLELIFELTKQEQKLRFERALSTMLEKAKKLNLPTVYRNELCVRPNQFIHQYSDGRINLIEQDSNDSSEKIIRIMNNIN